METTHLDVTIQDPWGNTQEGNTQEGLMLEALPWESWFQVWIGHTWQDLPPFAQSTAYELTLRFTEDREVQTLNRDYRGIDRPTDVLSFATLEGTEALLPPDLLSDSGEPLYLGDIVISVPTAQRQAEQGGHSLVVELSWLSVHGFLHLLGWDHPDEESFQRMVNQQLWLLEATGLESPKPLIFQSMP